MGYLLICIDTDYSTDFKTCAEIFSTLNIKPGQRKLLHKSLKYHQHNKK